MPETQQHLITEKNENDTRLAKLREFLDGAQVATVGQTEQIRLRLQADIMDLLSRVLGERIAAF